MDNNNWSAQQSAGLQQISAWLKDKHAPQIFRLFGFAGTGKTTIAKEIAGPLQVGIDAPVIVPGLDHRDEFMVLHGRRASGA